MPRLGADGLEYHPDALRAEFRDRSRVACGGGCHTWRTDHRAFANDEYVTIVQEKSRQLNEEMKRVARQDEQFLRDLVRLDELRQLQANEKEQRRKR